MGDKAKEGRAWLKALVVLLAAAFVWLNPVLRAVVIFILPLGSGPDDIAGVVLIIVIVALAATYVVSQVRKRRKEESQEIEESTDE